MLDVIRFWLDLGLDGCRLDAVPYLFEREGTNCENLPETHAFLQAPARRRRRGVPRPRAAGGGQPMARRTWSQYFGDGDECQMAFHFPVMPRMFMALRREQAAPDPRDPRPDARDPRRLRSGGSSCATTTS